MNVIKAMTYIVATNVGTIAYREGHEYLMWVAIIIGMMVFAYDFTMYAFSGKNSFLTDIMNDLFAGDDKKGASRGND